VLQILNGDAMTLRRDLGIRTGLVEKPDLTHQVRYVLAEDARACGSDFFLAEGPVIWRLLAVPIRPAVSRAVHWSTLTVAAFILFIVCHSFYRILSAEQFDRSLDPAMR